MAPFGMRVVSQVSALLLCAGSAAAQGPGRTAIGAAIGGLPFVAASIDLSASRLIVPHIALRADAIAHFSGGGISNAAPCPIDEPCVAAARGYQRAGFLLAGVQWFELRHQEGIYALAQVGAARLTGSTNRVEPVWAVGAGILFGLRATGISLDVHRVQLPRAYAERAVWPVTVGLHF